MLWYYFLQQKIIENMEVKVMEKVFMKVYRKEVKERYGRVIESMKNLVKKRSIMFLEEKEKDRKAPCSVGEILKELIMEKYGPTFAKDSRELYFPASLAKPTGLFMMAMWVAGSLRSVRISADFIVARGTVARPRPAQASEMFSLTMPASTAAIIFARSSGLPNFVMSAIITRLTGAFKTKSCPPATRPR